MIKTIEKTVSCGTIRGIEKKNTLEFRGIKYATAKRWEYPVLNAEWDGVYDATCFKACSYQRRAFEDDAVCNAFYHKEFRQGMSFDYSEDCLYLNIYTPKNAENCPVIFYIHGGSFTGGSSNEGQLDGTDIAENGVIFVSVNYRLGPFGFCSHPDLTNKNGICGNYGLYDQAKALKWVYKFIKDFGGNPEKITLMGQSAGAMSVDIHTSSPVSRKMINNAVLCSGAGLQRMLLKPTTPEKSRKFWDKVISNADVCSIDDLRQVDAKTLYYAWFDATKSEPLSIVYTLPVYDGKLLTENTFSAKAITNMPYMVGMTITDMMPAVLLTLTKKWAKCAPNTYTYMFSRLLPGDSAGAWHSSDLLYFFKTLNNNWRPFEEVDFKISNEMSQSIIAFAKSDNPNCKAVPNWKKSTDVPMTFCENTEAKKWDVKTIVQNTFAKGKTE